VDATARQAPWRCWHYMSAVVGCPRAQPAGDGAAASSSAWRRPRDITSTEKRKTPMNAPSLPAPAITRRLIEDFCHGPAPGAAAAIAGGRLSEREFKVVRMVAQGLSNAEIATKTLPQRGNHKRPRCPHPRQAGPARPRSNRGLRLRKRHRTAGPQHLNYSAIAAACQVPVIYCRRQPKTDQLTAGAPLISHCIADHEWRCWPLYKTACRINGAGTCPTPISGVHVPK